MMGLLSARIFKEGDAIEKCEVDTLQEPIIASTAMLRAPGQDGNFGAETMLSSGSTFLLVQVRYGQGNDAGAKP